MGRQCFAQNDCFAALGKIRRNELTCPKEPATLEESVGFQTRATLTIHKSSSSTQTSLMLLRGPMLGSTHQGYKPISILCLHAEFAKCRYVWLSQLIFV